MTEFPPAPGLHPQDSTKSVINSGKRLQEALNHKGTFNFPCEIESLGKQNSAEREA